MDGTDVSEQTNLSAGGEATAGAVAELAPAAPASVQDAPTPAESDPSAVAPPSPANGTEATAPPLEAAAPPPTPTASAPAAAPGDGNGVDLDAASLMEQFLNDPTHDYKSLKYGDVMDGIIMHVDREELLVDIGSKSEGIVPAREYSSLSQEEKQALAVGDQVLVFVVQPENQEGHAVVSIDRARQEKSWRRLQEIFEANEVIEAEVTNYNKGGLLVNLDGVRGFVPASQVTEIRGGDEASKQADMARLIGTTLPLKVIEINRHRNRLILSERQAVQERRDVMKERLIEELKEGEIRKGRVSSICDFGAFVDIGGADGLVHLSELSWSRVRHPSEVLKVGQEIDVYVLGINSQEKKIALSIKRTQAEPWSRVAANYEVGQLVRGTVTQLANFGAFARIEDGIEGLVHVSELVDDRVSHPKQVVSEGSQLLLRIIRIDPQRRRMGLSLRRALDTPDTELVNVFGPEVLEERDELVQEIRRRLEAEGLDGASALTGPAPAAEAAPSDSATEPAREPSSTTEPATANPLQAFEARMAAASQRQQQQQPRQRQPAPQQPQRPAVDLPDTGGEMSAMELAFAMAGASPDLVDEVAPAVPAAPPAPAAPAEAPPVAEASAAAADGAGEDGSASDGGQGEGGPAVGAIAGAIVDRIESVAETVTSTVSDVVENVVEAVRPDSAADAGTEAEESGADAASAAEPEAAAASDGSDRAS